MSTRRPRVLVAITVYNGRSFVLPCLASAAQFDQTQAAIDVLVLDDASPDPGFSEEVASLCSSLEFGYYRSQRNLGIVRNVNLGLLRATSANYDYVIVANSDVVFARNVVDELVAAVQSHERIGSVMAWSNNASIFSLPNADADYHLAQPETVDWLGAQFAQHFGNRVIDIPCSVSFCVLIPVDAVREVGLMDPIFGRGYCEETDWVLRSLAADYRAVFAPSAFAYHARGGSTRDAGLALNESGTVDANEAIIDYRYPDFRANVQKFLASGVMPALNEEATARLLQAGADEFGYTLQVGSLPAESDSHQGPRCLVAPGRGAAHVEVTYRGFERSIPIDDNGVRCALNEFFGRDPDQIIVLEHGVQANGVRAAFSSALAAIDDRACYPRRV